MTMTEIYRKTSDTKTTWDIPVCDECGAEKEVVAVLGNSVHVVNLCESCLHKALAVLEADRGKPKEVE